MKAAFSRVFVASLVSLAALAAPRAAWSAAPGSSGAAGAPAGSQQNYVACVNGDAGNCNPAQLTSDQRTRVEEASLQRNYVACSNGWASGCDPLRLTSDQKRIVDSVATQRQIAPCGTKWGMSCAPEAPTAPPPPPPAEAPRSSITTGPPRYDLDTQRFYTTNVYEAEPRYAWSGIAPWLVGGALVAATTWPLWADWDHHSSQWAWSHDYWRGGYWNHSHPYYPYYPRGWPPTYVPRPASHPRDKSGPMPVHFGKSK